MPLRDAFPAVLPVVRLLERLGVDYYIGGSVASSMFGTPRSTMDVDIVIEMQPVHIQAFVETLLDDYYVSETMIREALRHGTCFNVIHYATGSKIDLFVGSKGDFERAAMGRRVLKEVGGGHDAAQLFFASPEDTILAKIDWFQQGDCVSENQWRDVQGVLKVQRNVLDYDYLRDWAERIGIDGLLDQALVEANIVI